jgi:two-component system, NarL family, sensor kinase
MDTTETTLYTAILIVSIVLGTVLFYFAFSMYRGRVKHYRILTKQLLAEMDVLERERTRIATDLHDDLGPMLAVTKINLEQLEPTNATEQQRHSTAVRTLLTLTNRLGEIAKNLTPAILKSKGLQVALEEFIEQFNEVSDMQLKLEYMIKRKPNMFYALHIYRIVQELVHNAVKHSCAQHVLIQLKEHKQKLYIFYTDDGKGLDSAHKENQQTGLGLGSLQNRANLLGGKMTRTQTKTKGTDLVFELPLNKNDEKRNQDRIS